jgi:hypothetical protein
MLYDDEKDYVMRMIKEAARVMFSVLLGKKYTQVELEQEGKFEVSGRGVDSYKELIDRGEINEAENLLLDELDYTSQEEVAAAVLIYQYMGEKGEEFLRMHQYSQEVLDGLEQLGKKAGYEGVVRPQGY